MKKYLEQHRALVYQPEQTNTLGLAIYQNCYGWKDYYIGNNLLFSHRKTVYDLGSFPEKLHTHNFYELDVYLQGNICYVADDQEFVPMRYNIILFPPGSQHTARITDDGMYERYVFYFDSKLLDFLEEGYIGKLFANINAGCFYIQSSKRSEFYSCLEKLSQVLSTNSTDAAALAMCYVTKILLIVANYITVNSDAMFRMPQNVLEIKQYVDQNFLYLNKISQVADHFFYSREYVSRLFKRNYNISLSEYLASCKIQYAKRLLENGNSVSYCCRAAGFNGMSTFINAFRAQTQMTPVQYRQAYKKQTL